MPKSAELAISTLIAGRMCELGLSRFELVRRAGFKNVGKGLRRLDQLFSGDLKTSTFLIAGLPAALDLPPYVVADTVRQTEKQIAEAERIADQEREAVWRAQFKPSAYLLGTTDRPYSICLYGFAGGSERLRIPLDLSQPPVSFAGQALTVAQRTPTVTFFGTATGFIVNYSPDFAVRFDLNGNPVEEFNRAYRPAEVSLTIGKKTVPAETVAKIIGTLS